MRAVRPLLRRLRVPLLVVGAALSTALLIRALAVDAYRIPTSSMEPALLPGDLVLVEKWTLGPRAPRLLGGGRFPGLGQLAPGDVAVFERPLRGGRGDGPAFVKRVVGLPGDTVAIRGGVLFVNGRPFDPAPTLRDWAVQTALSPDASPVRDAGCEPPRCTVRERMAPGRWRVAATDEAIGQVQAALGITPVSAAPAGGAPLFPLGRPQTLDDYGPVVVPGRAAPVRLSEATWPYVRETLERYEGTTARRDPYGRFVVGGLAVTQARFRQDYVFVLGDNRHGSADSRHFGFVPSDHLIGRAAVVAFSWDERGRLRTPRIGEAVW